VEGKDAAITIVGYPKDVEAVYFGENGIIQNTRPGAYVIDMTTTSPLLAVRIYEEAKKAGLYALDAPVSGGDTGARNGTLSIMVGGDEEAFEQCRELFSCMGTNILYEGKAGSGQHTKMANQIAVAGAIAGVSEAFAYGQKMGLDCRKMLSSISTGAAGSWQMSNLGPRIMKDDFAPGFFIKHFIKDMNIAEEEAEAACLPLPILQTVLSMYEDLSAQGCDELGTQALIRHYNPQDVS
jgi:3-hydroxyisobutyrate dehydrogenase/2-hydroxy-3-oxopropionate reductase